MHKKSDVIIIGAGASGLMCAAAAGRRGRSVVILDHGERVGAKVLVSGGGKCNFTNREVSAEHYLSSNPHFCRSALARYTPEHFLVLLKQHDIRFFEKESGQLFCSSGSGDIVAMLRRECEKVKATVFLEHSVGTVEKKNEFIVSTNQGTFSSSSLVVASGGLSYASLGATDLGHRIARQFGLNIIPPRPALVPLLFGPSEKSFNELAGISIPAGVRSGKSFFRGNILFTHRGLSGPAILQISSFWTKGDAITLDLLPDTDIGAVLNERRDSGTELHNLLSRYFPKRFAQAWCRLVCPSKLIAHYSDKDLKRIAGLLHGWEIMPVGTEGYRIAEVTAGGVDTTCLSSRTMEAGSVPDLYFIGEVLDVTGHLGGYNLHWAWASGNAAGEVV